MAARKVRVPKQAGNGTCTVCRSTFMYHSAKIPNTCGLLYCRAMNEWTADDWEGASRMAYARQAADREIHSELKYDEEGEPYWVASIHPATLTPLDLEAMLRYP